MPTVLGRLTHLRALYLSNNKLTGNLPTELGRLTELKALAIYDNAFRNSIPSELGRLTRLNYCYLSQWKPGADTFSCPLPALPEACEAPQCEYSPPAPPSLPPALHVQVMVSVTTVLLYTLLALLLAATFLFAMRARRHPNGAKGVKDELQKEATAWLRRTIVPLGTYAVDARARLTAWAAATYDWLRSGCSFAQLQTMVIAGLSGLWAWMTSKAEAAWVVVQHEAPILWERVCVWSAGVWSGW